MNKIDRLHYFFSPPTLWIIQIAKDQLIFSQVIEHKITNQEHLYLAPYTILHTKIANPSSLCKGLQLFCTQKKLPRIRAWFLLPQEFFPQSLLPHELFQFLLSIKNAPVIPEKISTNHLAVPAQLTEQALPSILNAHNYMAMFTRHNTIHPGWSTLATTTVVVACALATEFMIPYKAKHKDPAQTAVQHEQKLAVPQAPTSSHCYAIKKSHILLTALANIIPPSIVLTRISTQALPHNNGKKASNTTLIVGITSNLQDLTHFVTGLEEALHQGCTLSYIKEDNQTKQQNMHKKLKKLPLIYHFSLSIDA